MKAALCNYLCNLLIRVFESRSQKCKKSRNIFTKLLRCCKFDFFKGRLWNFSENIYDVSSNFLEGFGNTHWSEVWRILIIFINYGNLYQKLIRMIKNSTIYSTKEVSGLFEIFTIILLLKLLQIRQNWEVLLNIW